MEDRIKRAVELFKEGFNCSQSVCAAFADMYGYTEEQALRMSASFGGGIGRMRMTCGAACGMFLLAGLHKGSTDGADRTGKEANYKLVQQLADEFARRNGSLICSDCLHSGIRIHSRKNELRNIIKNVPACRWWKRPPGYGRSTWKVKNNVVRTLVSSGGKV